MPLDKQAQAVLDQLAAAGAPPMETLAPALARQLPSLETAVLGVLSAHPLDRARTPVPEPVGLVQHRAIPGPGGDLLLRVYAPARGGPYPALLYFHGGGFVVSDLDTYDASCRALTNAAECVTVSVAYRQAPEHPFPAATEDAFAAYRWVLDHAGEIGGHAARVAVAGEGAGGNLAAVVCLLARERGVPLPLLQVLIYPITNHAFDTASYEEHADAQPLGRARMRWFWDHYLAGGADGADSHASPLRAPDLGGLPPALVITAEVDPLRDEGGAYAARLREAGVPVTHRHYDGVMHDFFGMPAVLDRAREAVTDTAGDLRTAFERAAEATAADLLAGTSGVGEGTAGKPNE